MKKIMALLVIICILVLTSCGGNDDNTTAPEGSLKFENDVVDYTFCYPATWRISSETGISSVEYTSASGHTAKVSVMAFETDAQSVNDYWNSYKKDISKTFSNFTLIGPNGESITGDASSAETSEHMTESAATTDESRDIDGTELMLDGVVALKVSYTASYGASENVYRFDQVLCLRNGTVYLVTFSALNNDYAAYVSGFDTVVNYFHFK